MLTLYYYYSAVCLFFCLVTALPYVFCDSFCDCFFCCVNQRDINLHVFVFIFFGGRWLFFVLLLLILNHITPRTRYSTIIPPCVLSDPLDHTCQLRVVFLPVTTPAKCVLIADFPPISPCFLASPYKYTLLYPCEPLRTHPGPFVPILLLFDKTWCSGKFPRP